jgi:hypothetical protein
VVAGLPGGGSEGGRPGDNENDSGGQQQQFPLWPKKKFSLKRTSYFSRFCIDAFRAVFFPQNILI